MSVIPTVDPIVVYQWLKPDWQPTANIPMSEPVGCTVPIETRIERASAYAAKISGSVTGSGTCHNEAMTVASRISVGFNLPPEHTLPILRQWNAKCVPPWSESELQHKADDAAKITVDKQGNRRGYLLGDNDIPLLPNVIDFYNNAYPNNTLGLSNNGTIAKSTKRTFAGIDASELSHYEHAEVDWLVDNLFSADQPTVFGAALKATKTTQLVDL